MLINARVTARATITGVERWALELTPRLRGLDPGRYAVARPPAIAASRAPGQAWEQLALPARAASIGARLIFSPANLAPLAWPRNVVLIHDAAALCRPEAYSAAYAGWHRWVGGAVARRALALVTVSEFSRRELVEHAGLDPERVTVVRGGVDERFSAEADHERAAAALGLVRPYVLTVGTDDPRKNLGALELTAERLRADGIDLVAAGDSRAHFSATGRTPGLKRIGYVSEADLPGLYSGALAFVLPSLYEGLGLPCLEAMASGVPVIAADRGALPETCGDAALLVDPEDPEQIAGAVQRALTDEQLRAKLTAAGLRRAGEFTWTEAASAVHRLLVSLAAAGHGSPSATCRPSAGR